MQLLTISTEHFSHGAYRVLAGPKFCGCLEERNNYCDPVKNYRKYVSYLSAPKILKNAQKRICNVYSTYENCGSTHKVQVETPEGKILLGRLKCISDENGNNDLKYIL